jgi:hypothetical protein
MLYVEPSQPTTGQYSIVQISGHGFPADSSVYRLLSLEGQAEPTTHSVASGGAVGALTLKVF